MSGKSKHGGQIKNQLREFREAYKKNDLSLTQEELAKRLKVTRHTVMAMEKGNYNPTLELAFKIAREFNVQIEDIFSYESAENEESS